MDSDDDSSDDETTTRKLKLQGTLQEISDIKMRNALLATLPAPSAARLCACAGSGNTMFWTLVKSDKARMISPEEYAVYGRFFLGMLQPELLAAEPYCAGCANSTDGNIKLRSRMDPLGLHAAIGCKKRGRRIALHDEIKWCLRDIAKHLLGGSAVWAEPTNRSIGNPQCKRRTDLIVHGCPDREPVSTDVTVCCPCSFTFVTAGGEHNAISKTGYAAGIAAGHKMAKHGPDAEHANVNFKPFACEMYGFIDKKGIEWLQNIGQRGIYQEKLTECTLERWLTGARQRVQICIARATARLLLYSAGANHETKLQGANAPLVVPDMRTGRADATKPNPNLLSVARNGPSDRLQEDFSDLTQISAENPPVAEINNEQHQHNEDDLHQSDVDEVNDEINREVIQDVPTRTREKWKYKELAYLTRVAEQVYKDMPTEELDKISYVRGRDTVFGQLSTEVRTVLLQHHSPKGLMARIKTLWRHVSYDVGVRQWLRAAGATQDLQFLAAC